MGMHSHKVVLEEFLQFSLGGRVGEVSNVKSPALSGARNDSLVLGSVDGLVGGGAFGVRGLEGGVSHLGGDSVDRHVGRVIDVCRCVVVD